MMVVSTRDFRTNQTKYLSMAKEGVDVILRSRAGNFKISPINDEDTVVNKSDLEAKLRHALQEVIDAKKGKIQLQSAEDLLNEL
jgi:antitoxin (DNA-binding transcriptional repressor) of toxin-antitoxin stability system